MSNLYMLAVCCLLLSIWGVFQLSLMSFFYHIEAFPMLSDVKVNAKYDSTSELLKGIKNNFAAVARNCLIAAGMYLVLLVVSILVMVKVKRDERNASLLDDDALCAPKEKKRKK